MTDVDTGRMSATTGGEGLPDELRRLETSLRTAFHAFDDIEAMTMPHRIRVVNDITSGVPDAASMAARAGYGGWAVGMIRAAAESRPAWSSLCARWDAMLASALDAIAAVDARV